MERFKLISAVHLFLISNGKILMLRRFNTGYEDGNYSVPAGHLDGGETVTQAAIRESLEEACVKLQPENLKVIHVMHRIKKEVGEERVDFFVYADIWEGEIAIGEVNKCDDLSWFPLEELPPNTIPYIKKTLEYFKDGIFYSEFGW